MAASPSTEDQWTLVSCSSDCSDDKGAPMSYPQTPSSRDSSDDEGFVIEGEAASVHMEQDRWLHALRSINIGDAKPSLAIDNDDDDGAADNHDDDGDVPLHDVCDDEAGAMYIVYNADKGDDGLQDVCNETSANNLCDTGVAFDAGILLGSIPEKGDFKLITPNVDPSHMNVELQTAVLVEDDAPKTEDAPVKARDMADFDEGTTTSIKQQEKGGISGLMEQEAEVNSMMVQEEDKPVADTNHTLPDINTQLDDVLDSLAHERVAVDVVGCDINTQLDDVLDSLAHERVAVDVVGYSHTQVDAAVDSSHEEGDELEPHFDASPDLVEQEITGSLTHPSSQGHEKVGDSNRVEIENKEAALVAGTSHARNAEENQNFQPAVQGEERWMATCCINMQEMPTSHECIEIAKKELASWEDCCRNKEAILARIKDERLNEEERLVQIAAKLEERRKHVKALERANTSNSQAKDTYDQIGRGSLVEAISINGSSTHETLTNSLQTQKTEKPTSESQKKETKMVTRNQHSSNAQSQLMVRNQSTLNAQSKAVGIPSSTNADDQKHDARVIGTAASNSFDQAIGSSSPTIMQTLGMVLVRCCNCFDGLAELLSERARVRSEELFVERLDDGRLPDLPSTINSKKKI